jgi:hypothetical protein
MYAVLRLYSVLLVVACSFMCWHFYVCMHRKRTVASTLTDTHLRGRRAVMVSETKFCRFQFSVMRLFLDFMFWCYWDYCEEARDFCFVRFQFFHVV